MKGNPRQTFVFLDMLGVQLECHALVAAQGDRLASHLLSENQWQPNVP
jgi:hypothetical protein